MLNVLCINNLKCGHNCECNEQPSLTHTHFGCVLINTRGQMWSTVDNVMPPIMTYSVDSMLQEETETFIYKCLNVPLIQEWLSI